MSSDVPVDSSARLRVMLIVHLSMLAGVLCFGVVAFIISPENPPPLPEVSLTLIGLVFGAVMLGNAVGVPVLLDSFYRRQALQRGQHAMLGTAGSESWWWGMYQTRLIITDALIESACFFLLIAFILEAQPITLATAIGLWTLMLVRTPTHGGVERWIRHQQHRLEMERP